MSDTESDTHPVYIGRDLKSTVKLEAADNDLTMRTVTERLIERGETRGYHLVPLPSEFEQRIDDIENEIEEAESDVEVEEALEELGDVEAQIVEADMPEDVQYLLDRIDQINRSA